MTQPGKNRTTLVNYNYASPVLLETVWVSCVTFLAQVCILTLGTWTVFKFQQALCLFSIYVSEIPLCLFWVSLIPLFLIFFKQQYHFRYKPKEYSVSQCFWILWPITDNWPILQPPWSRFSDPNVATDYCPFFSQD